MMNYNYFLIKISIALGMVLYVVKNTCLLNNHIFVLKNKKVICQKCRIIKETIRND